MQTLFTSIDRRLRIAGINALNNTAKIVQQSIVDEMRGVFHKPNAYTLNSLRVIPATASKASAEVTFKGSGAGHYLLPQVYGGPRLQKQSEKMLENVLPPTVYAIPAQGAKLDANGNMSPGQLVQILSFFRSFSEVGFSANRRGPMAVKWQKLRALHDAGFSDAVIRGMGISTVAIGTGGRVEYFIAPLTRGSKSLAIFQAIGRARGIPVLIITRQPQYRKLLDFFGIAERVADQELPIQLHKALAATGGDKLL